MKIKYVYTAFSFLIVGFLTIAAINSSKASDENSNKDIIKFSHKKHSEVSACGDCHTNVTASTNLKERLLPEKSTCATCHDVNDENECSKCHYQDKFEPLKQKTSELIFNHKLHLGNQNLTCESCHKELTEVDYSTEAKNSNPTMNTCFTCHNDNAIASSECKTCHISTVNLLPQDHKSLSFMKLHKFKSQEANSECQMCHENNFCESCHVGTTMITEDNTNRNFITPFSPHNFVDNTKQQNITRVHDINYRYTHGIDLKAKTTECQTCHQTETFCAECHASNGGDFALYGIVPSTHKSPNFVTIGVGSGGGQHAILAKRDVERCASCHDVQGADPICVMCHVDNDGIKGTNPKTHKTNFMRSSEDGDWHHDRGSVCYTCHTDANARPDGIKGVSFCGYCHK